MNLRGLTLKENVPMALVLMFLCLRIKSVKFLMGDFLRGSLLKNVRLIYFSRSHINIIKI
jgi:hypothetical protein